jgi:hypothetical protein
VAFPWDVLITAASTLAAAWGSAGLAGRISRKDRAAEAERKAASDRVEQRATAYKALVASAAEVQHNYMQRWGKFDDLSPTEQLSIRSRGDIVTGDLLRAIADVVLTGSDDARQSAEELRRTVLDAEAALEYGDDDDREQPLEYLEPAIQAFIDAARRPTESSELSMPQLADRPRHEGAS